MTHTDSWILSIIQLCNQDSNLRKGKEIRGLESDQQHIAQWTFANEDLCTQGYAVWYTTALSATERQKDRGGKSFCWCLLWFAFYVCLFFSWYYLYFEAFLFVVFWFIFISFWVFLWQSMLQECCGGGEWL